MPTDLLLPLSEVHREEQRSNDTVKRVLNAYRAREVEIIERSQHLTHAGIFFDDRIAEVFFPELDADKWALHEIRRTFKLPDDDFDARGHKKDLDGRVRKLASKLATSFGRLECKIGTDKDGHLYAKLTDRALEIVIETQYGRNATFIGGVSQSFRSYSIRAEAKVLALNQAERAAQRLRIAFMITGILAVPAAAVWLGYTITKALGLEMVHRLWLNEPGVTLALIFGAWIGGKAGQAASTVVDKRTFRRAEAQGALPRAESLWTALTAGIDEITGSMKSCEGIPVYRFGLIYII